MKRAVSLFILLSMLLALSACGTRQEDQVSFYYCRDPAEYQYFASDGVICAESRDIVGHSGGLRYAIGLYLAGPMEEGLLSPFPSSVRLLNVERTVDAVALTFSDLKDSLTDAEFSLACACLTLTCADLTGCREVTIISGERSVTMTTDSIRLMDDTVVTETTEGD